LPQGRAVPNTQRYIWGPLKMQNLKMQHMKLKDNARVRYCTACCRPEITV